MSATMRLLANQVLLLRLKAREKQGALYVPEVIQSERYLAEIIGLGPDVKGLALGDTVLMPAYGAEELDKAVTTALGFDEAQVVLVARDTVPLGVVYDPSTVEV